jgi:hypothetical protein
MNLGDTGWCGIDTMDLAVNRDLWRALENSLMNLPVP